MQIRFIFFLIWIDYFPLHTGPKQIKWRRFLFFGYPRCSCDDVEKKWKPPKTVLDVHNFCNDCLCWNNQRTWYSLFCFSAIHRITASIHSTPAWRPIAARTWASQTEAGSIISRRQGPPRTLRRRGQGFWAGLGIGVRHFRFQFPGLWDKVGVGLACQEGAEWPASLKNWSKRVNKFSTSLTPTFETQTGEGVY